MPIKSIASIAARARLPSALIAAIDQAAAVEADGNRSAMIKALLIDGLTSRGYWPPKAPSRS